MKNILFLFSLVLTCLSCTKGAEKTHTQPFEEETYEMLKTLLVTPAEEPVVEFVLSDKLTMEPFQAITDYPIKLEKAFAEEDVAYIRKQINDTTSFNINHAKSFGHVTIVEEDTIMKIHNEAVKARNFKLFWEKYRKKYGDKALLSVSKPIFSKDGKTAVILFGYSRGPLSGHGNIYKLEKTPTGWKIIKSLAGWIS